ncbi:MAG: hypothetical protein JO228_08230 [Xanthobacteraceae bacterium]|nr:hypothetical protein [Xanthobacteraceae bacterium]
MAGRLVLAALSRFLCTLVLVLCTLVLCTLGISLLHLRRALLALLARSLTRTTLMGVPGEVLGGCQSDASQNHGGTE